MFRADCQLEVCPPVPHQDCPPQDKRIKALKVSLRVWSGRSTPMISSSSSWNLSHGSSVIVSISIFSFCFQNPKTVGSGLKLSPSGVLTMSSESTRGRSVVVLWTARISTYFHFPDTKSFESQFARKREREGGFFTFREFHQFIRKLATRALLPKFVLEILEWKALDDLQ